MTRTLAAVALALVACGGGGRASSTALGHRAAPPAALACPPGGVHQQLDLDGDGRDDDVYLAPDADHVTCLEIRATRAPPLRCREGGDPIVFLEIDADGHVEESEPTACDPAGVPVVLVRPAAPPPADPSGRIPTGRTFQSAVVGAAAPSGTGLWLEGPDAFAAIVWRGGWRWFVVGA